MLEGDGPLALTAYELISTRSSGIDVEALSRSLSDGNASTYEQLTMYAKNCALDYFQRQVSSNMKISSAVIKAARPSNCT